MAKLAISFAGMSSLLLGCASVTPTPPTPVEYPLNWKLPVIAPAPQTRPSQGRGGLTIVAAPVAYSKAQQPRTRDEPYQPFIGTECTSYFRRHEWATANVDPSHLRFVVTINNGLTNVFRGAGALVTLNVNGRPLALDQSGYAELTSAMIPPRGNAQISVLGPSLDVLPDSGLVGLFIYDVVTATDAAGNPTRRENFEWFFDYHTKTEVDKGTVAITSMTRPTPGCVPKPRPQRRN
ncbi:MAG: hypothetical protein ACSLFK_07635 [Gemmatimonadaceae bacterium]